MTWQCAMYNENELQGVIGQSRGEIQHRKTKDLSSIKSILKQSKGKKKIEIYHAVTNH